MLMLWIFQLSIYLIVVGIGEKVVYVINLGKYDKIQFLTSNLVGNKYRSGENSQLRTVRQDIRFKT